MSEAPRRTMWAAAMMTRPLAERLDGMRTHGVSAMSVFPADMRSWNDEGLSDAEIGKMIREAGVDVIALDPFTGWAPGWSMDGVDIETRAFIDFSEDDIWRMADAIDAEKINAVHSVGDDFALASYADHLGAFAERAMAHGRHVAFEFMPISQVPDLATGWELVQASGKRVGLIFDTWHFWRSDPDHALLASIPGDRIFDVQIADGKAGITKDLMTDLMHHRQVPGDGDFDLMRTLDVLSGTGGLTSVGPETFSDAMNALSAGDAIQVNLAAIDRLLKGVASSSV